MKLERKYIDPDDPDETIMRPVPHDRDEQDTMLLPHPDETLLLEQQDPILENVPATNPFCTRAASLLSLVPKLRTQTAHDNVESLFEKLVHEIEEFESFEPQAGTSKKQNQIASYFLCALLDETILNTPWGSQHQWEQYSLLHHFHNDGQEGKKFFVILKQLLQMSKQYIYLVELAYICLSLGYKGIYHHVPNGAQTLAQYRQKLSDLIRRINGPETQILSTDWQGSRPPRKPLIHRIPLWVFISTICVLLMLIYFIIIYRVNKESDEVVARIDHIAEKEPILPSTPQMPQEQPKPSVPQIPQEHSKPSVPQIPQEQYISIPSENTVEEVLPETNSIPSTDDSNYSSTTNNNILDAERFREVFSKEIDEGKLAVLDGPTLRIINAFGPGNNRIKDDFIPMLSTLSKMLSATDSRILVVGHTDNQPVFSGHYPSNWHLSEARAKSVATHLADSEEMVERIRFEGHGDSEPVVDNDTEEHRALNRRIDIHIR